MRDIIILLGIALVVLVGIRDYKKSPKCKWCNGRHRGRCIWNPRSGRIFSNHRDGHFDWNDPNK